MASARRSEQTAHADSKLATEPSTSNLLIAPRLKKTAATLAGEDWVTGSTAYQRGLETVARLEISTQELMAMLEEWKQKEVEEQKRAKEAACLEAERQAKLMADEEEKKRLEDEEEARRMEEVKKKEEILQMRRKIAELTKKPARITVSKRFVDLIHF